MNQKSKRGGRRNPPGGRPPVPKHLQAVRLGFISLPQWLAEWLRTQEKPSKTVQEALIGYYKLTEPEKKTADNGGKDGK